MTARSDTASIIDRDHTNSPFALTLLYYYKYKRSMLMSESTLLKIVSKYGNYAKSSQLLSDLVSKYQYPAPCEVSLLFLSKLFATYRIPESYKTLCISNEQIIPVYDSKYDILSSEFDALASIHNKTLVASSLSHPSKPNISKVAYLVPGYTGILPENIRTNKRLEKTEIEKEVKIPWLHQIANFALTNGQLFGVTDSGPFSMLQRCFEEKARIQVIIRRRKRIHGILRGYLKGFDKHWNLLLKDVDQEYVPLSSKKHFPAKKILLNSGEHALKYREQDGILKRHLPQLFVRGDNIVLINRSFKS